MEKELFNDLVQSLKEAVLISKAYANGRMSRSVSHEATTLAWLERDSNNCAALLNAAIEMDDVDDLKAALRLVIDAKGGVAKIADKTGLSRETLYRMLSKKGNPKLSSVLPVLQAAGLKLVVQAK